jgi:hypothetical protein
MKNNKYSGFELGECGVYHTPHSLELELIYTFRNSNLVDTIYLLLEKGYVYQKELEKVLYMVDSRGIIRSLINKKIIERFILSEQEMKILSLIKGVNMKNMIYFSADRLTNEAKVLLQNPYIYQLLCSNANLDLKLYIQELKDIYSKKLEEIERNKQEEIEKILLRYNIAKQKNKAYLTGEDLAVIEIVEKDLYCH